VSISGAVVVPPLPPENVRAAATSLAAAGGGTMVCVAPTAPFRGGDVPALAAARGGCSDELLLVEPLERGSDVAELVVTIDCI